MENNFKDIFETISTLHKKYSTKQYLENIENFNKDSNDLVKILEKYKVDSNKNKSIKTKKETNKKIRKSKSGKLTKKQNMKLAKTKRIKKSNAIKRNTQTI